MSGWLIPDDEIEIRGKRYRVIEGDRQVRTFGTDVRDADGKVVRKAPLLGFVAVLAEPVPEGDEP